MNKIISTEQIEELKTLFRNRNSYQSIKTILDNLEENKVIDDLKRLIRNNGKSNMINKDKIQEIIEKND